MPEGESERNYDNTLTHDFIWEINHRWDASWQHFLVSSSSVGLLCCFLFCFLSELDNSWTERAIISSVSVWNCKDDDRWEELWKDTHTQAALFTDKVELERYLFGCLEMFGWWSVTIAEEKERKDLSSAWLVKQQQQLWLCMIDEGEIVITPEYRHFAEQSSPMLLLYVVSSHTQEDDCWAAFACRNPNYYDQVNCAFAAAVNHLKNAKIAN